MHEINGKRMNRYHELGQYAFGKIRATARLPTRHALTMSQPVLTPLLMTTGKRAGLWAVIPFQLIVMVGLGMQGFYALHLQAQISHIA